MKIAITTSGNDLSSALDMRFGRARKFLVYDLESSEFEIINNAQNLNAAQGAGIQAAQNVAATGATAVITGNCGPKAFAVLNRAGIKVFSSDAVSVAEALELYKNGKLTPAAAPTVEGHWI